MPARYLRHGAQPEEEPAIADMPQLEPYWAAGFSFSRGHFKLRVPYDAYQPMVFQVTFSCGSLTLVACVYCVGVRTTLLPAVVFTTFWSLFVRARRLPSGSGASRTATTFTHPRTQ
jgi:hypothetical protein